MNLVGMRHAFLVILLLTGALWSQNTGKGTKHDLNGHGCASCHVLQEPKVSEDEAREVRRPATVWDRNLPARMFFTYDDPRPARKTLPLGEKDPTLSSMLCVSCHDGVVTPSMAGSRSVNRVALSGSPDDHPVNVQYDPIRDATLTPLAIVTRNLKLFGATNTVQCSTCHDVHNDTAPMLLRMSGNSAALCIGCHQ